MVISDKSIIFEGLFSNSGLMIFEVTLAYG